MVLAVERDEKYLSMTSAKVQKKGCVCVCVCVFNTEGHLQIIYGFNKIFRKTVTQGTDCKVLQLIQVNI